MAMGIKQALGNTARVAAGSVQYLLTGRTPPSAYQSLIGLYCQSGGRSNDAMAGLLGWLHRPVALADQKGVLGNFSDGDLDRIDTDLRNKGYHVFDSRLPEDICDRLVDYATTQPCTQRATDDMQDDEVVPRFPRTNPSAIRYDFSEQALVCNADVQALMADRSLAAVAQRYLGSIPILDITAMWWNAASPNRSDKKAAQFWHFDMDRIRWLKFFIYLTDVGPDNGPHSFVAGSHRAGAIPAHLLKKGYSRLSDGEVESHYQEEKFIEFTAPRGTIIAEDTRGLHKGKNVARDDRLVLQFEYTNSLFGGEFVPVEIAGPIVSALDAMRKDYPRIYSRYSIRDLD
jgi:hypothetical protein